MFMRLEERGRGRESSQYAIRQWRREKREGRREKQKRSEIEDRGGKQG
jgi:hypothetical protein